MSNEPVLPVLLIGRAQPSIITSHFADDDGNFVFVICKHGGEKVMGKKLEIGRRFLVKATLEFVKYID